MAGPSIGHINLLAAGTISQSSAGTGTEEIAFPYERIFHPLIKKPWRSRHQTFTISANNNKLDFSVTAGGGSALVATITLADYRGQDLADEVATQMNTIAGTTDIFCEYNPNNFSFTISKTSGVLYLKWATGANKNNSIGPTLQFLCWLDLSGTLKYTGELDAHTTGGKYKVDSSNNQLYYNDGVNRTAAIPVGDYDAKGLAAEVKYQMDTTSSVTNFHANHYPTLKGAHKWVIGRAASTITLRCTVTTNAIWDLLGHSTAADKSGAQTYTADYTRIHGGLNGTSNEGEGIVIDLGTATTLRFVSVAGSNVTTAATGGTLLLGIHGNATDSWDAPSFTSTTPTANSYDRANKKSWFYWDFGVDRTFRFWRIQILNNDNIDGFVQIGNLFGGVPTQLTYNYNKAHEQTKLANTEKQITDAGAVYGSTKTSLKEFHFEWTNNLLQADKNFLDTLLDAVEDIVPFPMVLPFPLTTPQFLYCLFMHRPTFTEGPLQSGGVGAARWSCNNFDVRESA